MSGIKESSNEPPVAPASVDTTTGNGVAVERVVSLEAFVDLEAEWTDLLRRSDTDRVFFTHQWFRCWWEAFGQDRQLFVLCARRGDRLVGVAPLYASRSRFRGLRVRELRFMANGYSEECGFIVDAREPGVVQSLFRHLASARGEWDLLNLERVRLEAALWRERAAAVEACGLRYRTRPGLRVPYLLIDRSWETSWPRSRRPHASSSGFA